MQDGRDRARAQDWQDWQDWRGWERREGGGYLGRWWEQDQGTRANTSTNQPTLTLWYQSGISKMEKGEGGRTLAPLPRADEVTRRQHFGETGRLMRLGIWAVPPPPSHSHAANAHMGHQTRRRGCGRWCRRGRGRGQQMVHNGACGGIDVVVWWSWASLPCASIRRMKRLAQRAPR